MQIPESVLAPYVARYPHLRTLADNIRADTWISRQAALTFAQTACRLQAPRGASVRDIMGLARVAEGLPFHRSDKE